MAIAAVTDGKVEERAEAAPAAEEALVDEEREEQRQQRLRRDDDDHVVEGVAQRDGEVLPADPLLGEQFAIVVETVELGVEW